MDGLRQSEAPIDQEPFIFQQLSLWHQRGSQAIQGHLLVVLIERSLVYVQPLSIATEQGQRPALKRGIVGCGDRSALEETRVRPYASLSCGLTTTTDQNLWLSLW